MNGGAQTGSGHFRPATPNSKYVYSLTILAECFKKLGVLRKSFAPVHMLTNPAYRGQYSQSVLESLESQNENENTSILSSKVSQLKQLTVAIGDEIRDSSAFADKMNENFDNTRVRMKGTMRRMLRMAERTGVGWKVWLGFFVAVWCLFAWVWLF
jgi:blocked early in transport 1